MNVTHNSITVENTNLYEVLFLLLAVLPLTSCEKPLLTETTDEQEPNGNLVVSIFQIEHTPFESLTRTVASDVCTHLNYAVYALDGTRVKQINQKSEDAGFGVASFQLEQGDYQLVVVAHSSNGNPTMTDPKCIKFTNAQGYTDTFLSTNDVTISDEQVSMNVTLNRVVALCRFVITDNYPANVARMRFYYTGGSGAFNANTGLGCVNSKQSIFFDVSSGQKQFDLYTFLHDTEGTIHLLATAYDEGDNVLCEREFDIPLVQNKITWLSGPFFTNAPSSSTFSVLINTDWVGEFHLAF